MHETKFSIWHIAGLCALLVACTQDPAKGKPIAKVAEAPPPLNTQPLGEATAVTKYVFSNANSKIEFVGAKVTKKESGAFHTFTGVIELAENNLARSLIKAELVTDSVSAADPQLTEHLKSPEFLDVARFPKANFLSSAIVKGGEAGATHTVTGVLTLHGITKTVTFPAKVIIAPEHVDARAEFAIDRKQFGVNYPGMRDDLIADNVLLVLDLHAASVPH